MSDDPESATPPAAVLPGLRCFVLIVGNARSGSTLLGAALDGHPRAIVANEMGDSMSLWKGHSRDEVLARVVQHAAHNATTERASAGYRYQIGPPPERKRDVLVAGDKTWNPTLLLLHGNPGLLSSLEERLAVPVRLVYVIRNPFDVIATMHRRSGLSIRDRIRWYFMHCEAAEAMRERLPADRFLESHHATLLADAAGELGQVGRFLGLPHDGAHVAAVQSLLFEQPRRTADALAWSPAEIGEIADRIGDFPCLARYADERPTAG
jgi:pimeloyl-ACP methyl ester carboxylesterase